MIGQANQITIQTQLTSNYYEYLFKTVSYEINKIKIWP